MTFSHCGKFGDMLMCLPILSAYYKRTGDKPALALAQFPYVDTAIELLLLQECVGIIYRTPHRPRDMWGGWPYKPEQGYTVDIGDEVVYLGFRGHPDKPFIDFVAEEHGLEIDRDFRLNYGAADSQYAGKHVCIERYDAPILGPAGVEGEYIPRDVTILLALQLAAGAGSVSTYATGSAMALCLSGIKCRIYVNECDYQTRRDWVYNRFIERGTCELVAVK